MCIINTNYQSDLFGHQYLLVKLGLCLHFFSLMNFDIFLRVSILKFFLIGMLITTITCLKCFTTMSATKRLFYLGVFKVLEDGT